MRRLRRFHFNKMMLFLFTLLPQLIALSSDIDRRIEENRLPAKSDSPFNEAGLFLLSRRKCLASLHSESLDGTFVEQNNAPITPLQNSLDLNRCPVNAADSLADLAHVDPDAADLNALLNISASTEATTSNRTGDGQADDPSPPVHLLEEGTTQQKPTTQNNDQSSGARSDLESPSEGVAGEDAKTKAERSEPPPPPIATFEEWTKEKLMNKEKRPPPPLAKDTQQNAGVGNGANGGAPSEQNSQANGGGPASNNNAVTNGDATGSSAHSTIQPPTNAQNTGVPQPAANEPIKAIEIPAPEMAKRNYASKECGAKVLLANEEAEHRNAVLNDKERDEYMRNPCEKAQNKFLIIELCETIQPNLLEIANFELFSSGPREIRLSVSERYPTVEWTPVGQFVAQDTREMQAFHFTSPGIYAKFIRLELLSHHGKEHYCTLSTVRVSGISMVDEYEAEASNSLDSAVVAPPPVNQQPVVEQAVAENASPPAVNQQQQPEIVEPMKPPLNEQKTTTTTDPSNESVRSKTNNDDGKPFVLDKVVDLVGNLGQIAEVIGKPFLLGDRNGGRPSGRIPPNSCSHHCPIDLDLNYQCPLRCHLFGVIDVSRDRIAPRPIRAPKTEPAAQQSRGQKEFLRAIVRLSQCPTAASAAAPATKLLDPQREQQATEVKEPPPADIAPNSAPPKAETGDTKKLETATPSQQQQQIQPPNNAATNQPPLNGAPVQQQQQQAHVPKPPPISSLPGTTSTHKESVFMKLNKRLAALELNMSLSSEYLSELSRRYVAQQDGYNKQHERDLKTLQEMVNKLGEQLKSAWSEEINRVRGEINSLAREMRLIKERNPFETATTSSLALHNRYKGQYDQNCFNIPEPPASDRLEIGATENHDAAAAWTNEQIVAVVTLSNLSAFTFFAVFYLLYKIFSRRKRIQSSQFLNPDEIRQLIQREVNRLTQEREEQERADAGETVDLASMDCRGSLLSRELNCIEQIPPYSNGKKQPSSARRNRQKQQQQKRQIPSVASSTLSLPSSVGTSSTSALDTMSSSPSLSDAEQNAERKQQRIPDPTTNGPSSRANEEEERSVSSNALLEVRPPTSSPLEVQSPARPDLINQRDQSQRQQLSPPWQTVPNRRKFSDRSLRNAKGHSAKVKIN